MLERPIHQAQALNFALACNNDQFLDELPEPPNYQDIDENDPIMNEIKRWRLQILLAANPWGIPSLAFGEAYRKMFAKELDVREMGFKHLSEMVNKMPEIFAVQEPDESTRILFPDYASDRILHDSRLGYDFARSNFDSELCASRSSICTSHSGGSSSLATATAMAKSGTLSGYGTNNTITEQDYDELIHRAWMDRDEEFPPDVVLAGEPYEELLNISSAMLPGTRGLYQATLLSAALPDSIYVRLKTSEQEALRASELSNNIKEYFEQNKYSIDAYSVPREFFYPGFPCLVYMDKQAKTGCTSTWERCIIAAKSQGSRVIVDLVDFGGLYSVDIIYLYLIPRKFLDIPRQTFQVSLAGVKPSSSNNGVWHNKVGPRLRCFSFSDYWLDIVLMDLKQGNQDREVNNTCSTKVGGKNGIQIEHNSELSLDENDATQANKRTDKTRRRIKDKPRFDAVIIDRNDEDIDVYLDEILILETYAIADEGRTEEIAAIKKQLNEVLKTIPRPKNPFYAGDKR